MTEGKQSPTIGSVATQMHTSEMNVGLVEPSDLDMLNATNRDMFSWLLFNSEHITAPNGQLNGISQASTTLNSGNSSPGLSLLDNNLSQLHDSTFPITPSELAIPSQQAQVPPHALMLTPDAGATAKRRKLSLKSTSQDNDILPSNTSELKMMVDMSALAPRVIATSSIDFQAQPNGHFKKSISMDAMATMKSNKRKPTKKRSPTSNSTTKQLKQGNNTSDKGVSNLPIVKQETIVSTNASKSLETKTTNDFLNQFDLSKHQAITGQLDMNLVNMNTMADIFHAHSNSRGNIAALKQVTTGKRIANSPSSSTSSKSSSMSTKVGNTNSTSASPRVNKNNDNGSDTSLSSLQRKQKLERNRESARECRRRKREHILGVEERCRQLERENMELRGQLKAGKEAIKQEEKEKNLVCEELELMIKRGASEKELAEKIDNFKEQYSDYGHGRTSALNYHLHQIERLLLPTQVTKMCIWALRQDDSFWQDEEDETSLPVILAKELGLSEEQKKKIQQQRGSIQLICENLKNALALLNDLRVQVTNKNSTLDMEMDKLQNILTPTQRAKFIVWVTNNPACMHLLNKLWRSVL